MGVDGYGIECGGRWVCVIMRACLCVVLYGQECVCTQQSDRLECLSSAFGEWL